MSAGPASPHRAGSRSRNSWGGSTMWSLTEISWTSSRSMQRRTLLSAGGPEVLCDTGTCESDGMWTVGAVLFDIGHTLAYRRGEHELLIEGAHELGVDLD